MKFKHCSHFSIRWIVLGKVPWPPYKMVSGHPLPFGEELQLDIFLAKVLVAPANTPWQLEGALEIGSSGQFSANMPTLPSSFVKFKSIGNSEGLWWSWLRSTAGNDPMGLRTPYREGAAWSGDPSNVREHWSRHHAWLRLAETPRLSTSSVAAEHMHEPGKRWPRSPSMEHPEPRVVTSRKEDCCPQEQLDQGRDPNRHVQPHWHRQETIPLYWTSFQQPTMQQEHQKQLKLSLPAGGLVAFPVLPAPACGSQIGDFGLTTHWGFFFFCNPKAPRDLLRFLKIWWVRRWGLNPFSSKNMKCDQIHTHAYEAGHLICSNSTHFRILPWLASPMSNLSV